ARRPERGRAPAPERLACAHRGAPGLAACANQGAPMTSDTRRRTVDLRAYPDLVVIVLGMQVRAFAGLKTLLGFGPKIARSVAEQPEGLLLHESFVFSLFPPHVG